MVGNEPLLVLLSFVLMGFAAWYGVYYAEKKKRSTHIAMNKVGKWAAVAAVLIALGIWVWFLVSYYRPTLLTTIINLFPILVTYLLLVIVLRDIGEADTEAKYKEVVFHAMSLASISLAIILWLLSG